MVGSIFDYSNDFRQMGTVKWHEISMSIQILLPPHTMRKEFMMIINEQPVVLTVMSEQVTLNEFPARQDITYS